MNINASKMIQVCSRALCLIRARGHGQYHSQSSHNKSTSNEGRQSNTASTRRKLTSNNPILALEISVEPHEED